MGGKACSEDRVISETKAVEVEVGSVVEEVGVLRILRVTVCEEEEFE